MDTRIPFGELPQYPGPLNMGMQGNGVGLFQELMTLTGFTLTIDRKFGDASRKALLALSGREELDETVWNILIKQLEFALREIPPAPTLQLTALAYAKRHLRAGARELNQNSGPWVRLYTRGSEGPEFYWCAGFVSFCIAQACNTLTLPPAGGLYSTIPYTLSCDELGRWAREHGALITRRGERIIQPGSLFLEGSDQFDPESNPDYVHTGFVDEFWGDSFTSVEGNSGDKVYAKYRAFGSRPIHFIDPTVLSAAV